MDPNRTCGVFNVINMHSKSACAIMWRLAATCTGICGLMASEYHGTVKTGGLPLAGVTITAGQGAKTVTTTTDVPIDRLLREPA